MKLIKKNYVAVNICMVLSLLSGSSLIIYHSPLPHTYALSSLHRPPESYRPVTSAPTLFYNLYSHRNPFITKLHLPEYQFCIHSSQVAEFSALGAQH